jgi:hypothetical protein
MTTTDLDYSDDAIEGALADIGLPDTHLGRAWDGQFIPSAHGDETNVQIGLAVAADRLLPVKERRRFIWDENNDLAGFVSDPADTVHWKPDYDDPAHTRWFQAVGLEARVLPAGNRLFLVVLIRHRPSLAYEGARAAMVRFAAEAAR